MWEFSWSHMDDVQRRVIEFGLDAGFGERNVSGSGLSMWCDNRMFFVSQ